MATGLLTADAPGIGSAFGTPQWGIWDENGSPLLVTDAVADVEYSRDYHISDYPQEKGAFESYNKVQVPFQAKVGFYISQNRAEFLGSVEAAVFSLKLVTVVTPEQQYPSANLTHYSYRREARSGVTLIRVDVWCEEVRIVEGIAPISAQSTNAASSTQSGQVQPTLTSQLSPPGSDGGSTGPATVGGGFAVDTGLGPSSSTSGLSVSADLRNVSGSLGLPDFIQPGIPTASGAAASESPPPGLSFTPPEFATP